MDDNVSLTGRKWLPCGRDLGDEEVLDVGFVVGDQTSKGRKVVAMAMILGYHNLAVLADAHSASA